LLTQRVGPVKSGHSHHHYHLVKTELVLAMIWLKNKAIIIINSSIGGMFINDIAKNKNRDPGGSMS
jgi:hypothetical protein